MAQLAGATAPRNLPPARRPVRSDETATGETRVRKKSSFLPFLLAILMAGALLALIGWQAGPWNPGSAENPSNPNPQAKMHPAARTPQQQQQTSPVTTAPVSTAPVTAAPAPSVDKPSPMGAAPVPAAKSPETQAAAPTETKPAQETPAPPVAPVQKAPEKTTSPPKLAVTQPPPDRTAAPPLQPKTLPEQRTRPAPHPAVPSPQPVSVISSPGGATATLDGRPDITCTTPCSIDAAPGRHNIAITMPGYQVEHREVVVGTGPVELPAVLLRAPSGTLMLTSVPAGAAISVNGQKQTQVTPAQLHLPPGSYQITVEKDGLTSTTPIELHNGETKLMKLTLQQ